MSNRTNHLSILFLLLVSTLIANCLSANKARAEIQPSFELEVCVDRAELIAIGELDSENVFNITQVLNTVRMDFEPIKLKGPDYYQSLSGAMEQRGKIEMLAFINKEGHPVLGSAALIGFKGQDTFVIDHSLVVGLRHRGDIPPALHPRLKRDALIESTKIVWAFTKRRRELEKLAPSAERAVKIYECLFEFEEAIAMLEVPRSYNSYQKALFIRSIKESAKKNLESVKLEGMAFIDALDQAPSNEARISILGLISSIPMFPRSYDLVVKWTAKEQSPDVRRWTYLTLATIDKHRTTEDLIPKLSVDNPDTPMMLSALRYGSNSSDYWLRSPKMISVLKKLSANQREAIESGVVEVRDPLNKAIVDAIVDFLHPQLVSELNAWAKSSAAIHKHAHHFQDAWKTGDVDLSLMQSEFRLDSPQGVTSWLKAFQECDPNVQKILSRVWLFQEATDCDRLLKIAKEKDNDLRPSAIQTLGLLWESRRLTVKAKKKIMQDLVEVKLVELDVPSIARGVRQLRIEAKTDFPFPPSEWFQASSSIKIGDGKPKINDSWSVQQMFSDRVNVFGSRGGGVNKGSPNANAIVRLRQVDNQTGKVQWEHRWELPPIKLQNSATYRIPQESKLIGILIHNGLLLWP